MASGITSAATREEPSRAPWFSGKYTRKPSARSSSAGPTLVHHATFAEPVRDASSSSPKYSAMTSRMAFVERIFLMALFSWLIRPP